MIVREIRLFLTAVQFFTRIPVRCGASADPQDLASSLCYLPLIGLLIGASASGSTLLAATLWPWPVAVLLGMAVGILLTGAFHEDGFADTCDGFGGGWTADDILRIMKDARLGSYGAIGLVLMLGLKGTCLVQMSLPQLLWALPLAHAWSRLLACSLTRSLRYVRTDGSAKVPALVQGLSRRRLLLATLAPLAVLPLVDSLPRALALGLGLLGLHLSLTRWYRVRLGGYTGDCLGAAQQIAELVLYLILLAAPPPWN